MLSEVVSDKKKNNYIHIPVISVFEIHIFQLIEILCLIYLYINIFNACYIRKKVIIVITTIF